MLASGLKVGWDTPSCVRGFGSSLMMKGERRMLGVIRNVEYAPKVVRVSNVV